MQISVDNKTTDLPGSPDSDPSSSHDRHRLDCVHAALDTVDLCLAIL